MVDGMWMTRLDGKRFGPWAVVTGASSGIGQEFARQIAASGINLVLVSRRAEALEETGQALQVQYDIAYRVIAVDLSEPGADEAVAAGTADLDVGLLISAAGTGQPGAFLAFEAEQLLAQTQLMGVSHMLLTHHFSRRFAAQKRGATLLVSALGADSGIPYHANPAAAKGLVNALGRSLHAELKELGVGITTLIVTPTETPLIKKMGLDASPMPIKPMPVAQCVAEALDGVKRGKMIVVPGRLYRIMNALMPHSLVRAMTANMMRQSTTFVG
ncbi:SDR family NAD(P)-dependent oxidoreductase [Devosia sp. XK-2]|uniref:SDR family NAD(P)-dependent oxidoreductase n=1 Tax=Devosia sp. XK-2 TaxID=3126689 RepID=UPI0030D05436